MRRGCRQVLLVSSSPGSVNAFPAFAATHEPHTVLSHLDAEDASPSDACLGRQGGVSRVILGQDVLRQSSFAAFFPPL